MKKTQLNLVIASIDTIQQSQTTKLDNIVYNFHKHKK